MITTNERLRLWLDGIAEQNGGELRPDDVVAAAQDPNSPGHDHFTWDDAQAATERRIDQARRLIRTVRVFFHDDQTSISAVVYVKNPDSEPRQQGYVQAYGLRDDPDRARRAVDAELLRINALLVRAREIAVEAGCQEYLTEKVRAFTQMVS